MMEFVGAEAEAYRAGVLARHQQQPKELNRGVAWLKGWQDLDAALTGRKDPGRPGLALLRQKEREVRLRSVGF